MTDVDHDRDRDPDGDLRSPTDPEAAFLTLSNDLRLEILLALWEAPGFTLSSSDLRAAVGERDSGKFSYHLQELVDHFVGRVDEGYELRYPGHRVLDAIQSGVFHQEGRVGPVDLDSTCYRCGGTLRFAYGTDFVGRVHCLDCDARVLEWPFDPGGVADRTPAAVADAFDRRTRLVWGCAVDGVCPFCAGRVERAFVDDADEAGHCIGVVEGLDRYDDYFARDHPVLVDVDCRRCSFFSLLPVGVVALSHPGVTGRLWRRGRDVRATPLWGLAFVVDPTTVDVRRRDPTTVALDARAPEGDDLTVLVDETFAVTTADAETPKKNY